MNKKVVFLVVLLECILAVFIVSVFGHAIEDDRKQILCRDIYFVNELGEKYEDVVKVYTIGDFSKEICGGPHVESTGKLGKFKIQKEQSSGSGIRRIKAVLL